MKKSNKYLLSMLVAGSILALCTSSSVFALMLTQTAPKDTEGAGTIAQSLTAAPANIRLIDDFVDTLYNENVLRYWTDGGKADTVGLGGLVANEDVSSSDPLVAPFAAAHKISYKGTQGLLPQDWALYQWWATSLWDGLNGDTKKSIIRYTHISFEVRGAAGGEDFYIGLQESNKKKFDLQIRASNFTKGGFISTEWKSVKVPLNKFIENPANPIENPGVNLNDIQAIDFMFYVPDEPDGTIYIANLRLEGAMIDDFENGAPDENLLRHPSSTGAGRMAESTDVIDTLNTNNKAHKLTWNISDPNLPGFWYSNTFFAPWDVREPTDISLYDTLNLRVRGETGGETFKIEFQEAVENQPENRVELSSSSYITLTNTWQALSIPLGDFVAAGVGNKNNLAALSLLFGKTGDTSAGTIYIDDIYLSYTNQAPTINIALGESKHLYVGHLNSFYIPGSDPEDDHLVYTAGNLPSAAEAEVRFDAGSGLITIRPFAAGGATLNLTASDGMYSDTKQLALTYINPPPQKPQSMGIVSVDKLNKDLLVKGKTYKIKGVGYNPVPVGEDPSITPFVFTQDILDRDMPNLRELRANTLRVWSPVNLALMDAARDNGMKVCALYWVNPLYDFTDPVARDVLINGGTGPLGDEFGFRNFVAVNKAHPALLMWVLGNEVDLAIQDDPANLKAWYSLANEMAKAAFEEEGGIDLVGGGVGIYHPVALSSGILRNVGNIDLGTTDADLNYIDIMAMNAYRGYSFEYKNFIQENIVASNYFKDFAGLTDKPLWIAEYGIDSYVTTDYDLAGLPVNGYLDEATKAAWSVNATREILGLAGIPPQDTNNVIGGSIMAYSDEWWKAQGGSPSAQELGGYSTLGIGNDMHPDDFANEEHWGLFSIADNGAGLDLLTRKTGLDDQGQRRSPYEDLRDQAFNEAPVFIVPADGEARTFYVGENNGFTVIARDPNGDILKKDPVTLKAINVTPAVTGASLSAETYNSSLVTAIYSWNPTVGDVGDYQVAFTVAEDDSYETSKSSTSTITIHVVSGTDSAAPIAVISPEDFSIPVGTEIELDGSASTDDVGIQSYKWDFNWTGGEITPDPGADKPIVVHTYSTEGVYTVGLQVTDGVNKKAWASIVVTVTSAFQQPPTIWPIGPKSIVAGLPLVFDITANDPEGDNVTLSCAWLEAGGIEHPIDWQGSDLGATFIDQGWDTLLNPPAFRGTFNWTPANYQAFPYDIKFTATDQWGNSSSETILLTVYSDDLPPTITVDESVTPADAGVSSPSVRYKAELKDDQSLVAKYDLKLYKDGVAAPVASFVFFPGVASLTIDHTHVVTDPAEDGALYRWTLIVEDPHVNVATDTRLFRVSFDVMPPAVNITSPVDGYNTMDPLDPNLQFHADVSDNEGLDYAELYIYNSAYPTGKLLKTVPYNWALSGVLDYTPIAGDIVDGDNTYTLIVKDVNENFASELRNFSVGDTEPPMLTITEPAYSFVTTKYPKFTFQVTDNIGISRVKIGMIGKGMFVDMALDGTGSFSYTFDPENLPDPSNPPSNVTSMTVYNGNIDAVFPLSNRWNYYYGVQAYDVNGNNSFAFKLFLVYISSGNHGCFLAGTPVLLPDGSTKAIETFKVGDTILAYDEETKQFRQDQVKHVFVFPEEEGYFVINSHIKVTPRHRFLVEKGRWTIDDRRQAGGNEPQWKEAGELKLGDRLIKGQTLLTRRGQIQASAEVNGGPVPSGISPELIASIEYIQEPVPVYNLEVNPYHTFIAGGVVVHNAISKFAKIGPIAK